MNFFILIESVETITLSINNEHLATAMLYAIKGYPESSLIFLSKIDLDPERAGIIAITPLKAFQPTQSLYYWDLNRNKP